MNIQTVPHSVTLTWPGLSTLPIPSTDVEFCTPLSGGGPSPKVREALLNLAGAIRDENESNPIGSREDHKRAVTSLDADYAVASKSAGDFSWQLLPNSLLSDKDSTIGYATTLANAGDTETQYCGVKNARGGVTPVATALSTVAAFPELPPIWLVSFAED